LLPSALVPPLTSSALGTLPSPPALALSRDAELDRQPYEDEADGVAEVLDVVAVTEVEVADEESRGVEVVVCADDDVAPCTGEYYRGEVSRHQGRNLDTASVI